MDNSTALPVLFRDEHLIAVAKPSGVFVHRSENNRTERDVVLQAVRDQIGTFLYPVHRLDRATSGIVLLAQTRYAASEMSRAFADRKVSKTYVALVRGHCVSDGRIATPLVPARGRGKPKGHPYAVPQEAETIFHTIEQFELPVRNDRYETTRSSLVEVKPRTGRFHQIRRHFNYISHPVIGDTSHGDSRHNSLYRKHFNLQRLMLAAVRLEFSHPVTGEQIDISCRPDSTFTDIVKRLQQCQAGRLRVSPLSE